MSFIVPSLEEEENLQRGKTLDRQSRKSWGREERRKTYMQYRERVSVSVSFCKNSTRAKTSFSFITNHIFCYWMIVHFEDYEV